MKSAKLLLLLAFVAFGMASAQADTIECKEVHLVACRGQHRVLHFSAQGCEVICQANALPSPAPKGYSDITINPDFPNNSLPSGVTQDLTIVDNGHGSVDISGKSSASERAKLLSSKPDPSQLSKCAWTNPQSVVLSSTSDGTKLCKGAVKCWMNSLSLNIEATAACFAPASAQACPDAQACVDSKPSRVLDAKAVIAAPRGTSSDGTSGTAGSGN